MTNHLYCRVRKKVSKFSWVVSCMAKVELQFEYDSFCPFFAKHLPYLFYRLSIIFFTMSIPTYIGIAIASSDYNYGNTNKLGCINKAQS